MKKLLLALAVILNIIGIICALLFVLTDINDVLFIIISLVTITVGNVCNLWRTKIK